VLKDKIVILISHRLYNLKMADKIYVMQDGKIVQQGIFDQLIVEEGLFKSMYEKQRI
jgi:ATP-binding cassette subfamily B protein